MSFEGYRGGTTTGSQAVMPASRRDTRARTSEPVSSSVSMSVHPWFNIWLRLSRAGSICDFFNPNRAVVLKPTEEANRCNLRHVAPKTLQ